MRFLTVLSLLLVAVTMATSLAHALEWPGKRRLGEAAYKTTQAIYYPGFTFGGLFGEFRRDGLACRAVLSDAGRNKSLLVDGRSPALDVGGAHGLLADDAPDQQLLGQGRGHIGGWFGVLFDIRSHTNRRLDGTARRLGTLARGQSLLACAFPDRDRHGNVAVSIGGPTYEQTSCPQLLHFPRWIWRRVTPESREPFGRRR